MRTQTAQDMHNSSGSGSPKNLEARIAPLATSSGIRLPVEPWRGQMLAFDAPARPLRHNVFCGELVLVARPHGPLVVGTTLEKVGYDERVTLSGVEQIL